jgi:hypothetical protein
LIMYVKPEISEEKAREILFRRRPFLPFKFLKKPFQLKRIELIYLPIYLFDIVLTGKQNFTIAVDGLLGDTLFFVDDKLQYQDNTEHSVCDFALPSIEAKEKALKEYKTMLLEQGLRSRKSAAVETISEGKKIYYPFWIGYYLKGKAYDFKSLDALSGQIQGIKMRKVFLKALRLMSQTGK